MLAGTTLLRHFESTILALAARGHQIRIATPPDKEQWKLPHRLRDHPQVSTVECPGRRGDDWRESVHLLRSFGDYLRYFDDAFLPAAPLRARAFDHFTQVTTKADGATNGEAGVDESERFGRWLGGGDGNGPARVRRLLSLMEAAVPSDPAHDEFMRAEAPDILLVTPLIFLGGQQADYVKSARAAGIPVGFPVFSWDNLTTKGIVHVQPDRVFVWNDVQKAEAVRFHGVPEDRIAVTGAPRFDEFIEMRPSVTREEFCAAYGLDPSQPTLAYLCSSEFVAANEAEFVRRWVTEIRSDPALQCCNIVIRPHPRAAAGWEAFDRSAWPHVAVAMSKRMKSKTVNVDQALFDFIYHSTAVVGLNTSAQIEAGILGRPVYTMLAPAGTAGQQGTLHFEYLLRKAGGFVELAADFAEHRRQLADAVAGRYDADGIRAAVAAFIRPAGWDRAATPLLADAIEQLLPPSKTSVVSRLLGRRGRRFRSPAPA